MIVESGKQVSIEYTLSTTDQENGEGAEAEESPKEHTYVHGEGKVIPGLEQALEGMTPGETKSFSVQPKNGFGERSDEAFQEVDKRVVPEELHKIDTQIQGQDEQGGVVNARVADVRKDTILLDLNHPLAGKTLHFTVKVVDVRECGA